eukprot:scaffold29650_cov40-Tisochrysis_lutea.AAC.1
MLRLTTLLAATTAAVAGPVELTPANFDELVINSGKAAFVKFFAPWCGHCKKLKPDWDALAEVHEGSQKVLIADVDCTAAGKPLCEKYGVRGYPTLKYFNPPSEDGEDYKGGRTLAELKKFAETELGPGCSVDMMENCSEEQKKELETYVAMPAEERNSMLETLKKEVADAEAAHEALLKELQASYKASMEKVEQLKESAAPKIKLLKAATPSVKPEATKDEV